jgi:predicted anti-sigma-YlaC factor YlaD
MMSCHNFEAHLDAFLEGTLEDVDQQRLEQHLDACAACRELAEIAAGNGDAAAEQRSPELCSAILAETSGAACGLAYSDLCGWADGRLAGAERERVRLHLALCVDCRGLATVLGRLTEDLSALRVQRSPLPIEMRLALALGRGVARVAGFWQQLLARPRFALEGAYVGTLVLAILFILPASPLRGLSSGALTLTQSNPVAVLETPLESVGRIAADLWRSASAPGTAALGKLEAGLELRYQGTSQAAMAMKRHGGELGEAAVSFDFAGGRQAMRHLNTDVGSFFEAFAGSRKKLQNDDSDPTTKKEEHHE